MCLMHTDLPVPEGPSITQISPAGMVSVTSPGSARMMPARSPFGVAVDVNGTHVYDVTVAADVRHLPLLRETARSFAIKRGARHPDEVRLAVGEACTNVIQHAYDPGATGELHLHGALDGHWVRFTVEDRGSGSEPGRRGVPPPGEAEGVQSERGPSGVRQVCGLALAGRTPVSA